MKFLFGEGVNKLNGIFPVIHTPFTDNGAIDYDDLRREVDTVIKDGADGLVVFGYATEFPFLSESESDNLLSAIISECNRRVPVISSVTAICAREAKKDAARYQDMGADAIMLLPRCENPVEYMKTAVSDSALPVLMQYAPHATGIYMSAAEIAGFAAELGRPFGVKSEMPMDFITELSEASSGQIAVYVGRQGINMHEALERGASGIMPGCSRVYAYKKIYDEYSRGSKEKALELYDVLAPYLSVFHGQYEMYYEKYALVRRGVFKKGYCRQPLSCPSPDMIKEFDKRCGDVDRIFL